MAKLSGQDADRLVDPSWVTVDQGEIDGREWFILRKQKYVGYVVADEGSGEDDRCTGLRGSVYACKCDIAFIIKHWEEYK